MDGSRTSSSDHQRSCPKVPIEKHRMLIRNTLEIDIRQWEVVYGEENMGVVPRAQHPIGIHFSHLPPDQWASRGNKLQIDSRFEG